MIIKKLPVRMTERLTRRRNQVERLFNAGPVQDLSLPELTAS
jgi:hypothetical protein